MKREDVLKLRRLAQGRYAADQPRDEAGRFASTGAMIEKSKTASQDADKLSIRANNASLRVPESFHESFKGHEQAAKMHEKAAHTHRLAGIYARTVASKVKTGTVHSDSIRQAEHHDSQERYHNEKAAEHKKKSIF